MNNFIDHQYRGVKVVYFGGYSLTEVYSIELRIGSLSISYDLTNNYTKEFFLIKINQFFYIKDNKNQVTVKILTENGPVVSHHILDIQKSIHNKILKVKDFKIQLQLFNF